MELKILKAIDFELNIPVPYRFLRRYARVSCLYSCGISGILWQRNFICTVLILILCILLQQIMIVIVKLSPKNFSNYLNGTNCKNLYAKNPIFLKLQKLIPAKNWKTPNFWESSTLLTNS